MASASHPPPTFSSVCQATTSTSHLLKGMVHSNLGLYLFPIWPQWHCCQPIVERPQASAGRQTTHLNVDTAYLRVHASVIKKPYHKGLNRQCPAVFLSMQTLEDLSKTALKRTVLLLLRRENYYSPVTAIQSTSDSSLAQLILPSTWQAEEQHIPSDQPAPDSEVLNAGR